MSLDLSVITDKKLTDQILNSVIDLLETNGFVKDQNRYFKKNETISLDIYVDLEPENDEYWTNDPPKAVWFIPLTDIDLESRHNRESHEMNYGIAKQLAEILDGVIYDHQVGVVYDSNGMPCDHHKTGEQFEIYGSGMDLFMRGTGLLNDIIER